MSSPAENAEDFGGGGGEFGTDTRDGLPQDGDEKTGEQQDQENDNENENSDEEKEINGEDSLEKCEEKMEVQDEDNKVCVRSNKDYIFVT